MNATTTARLHNLLGVALAGVFALSAGCVGHEPAIGGDYDDYEDDSGESNDPEDDVADPENPMDVSGRYSLESRFDMASALPGQVGKVANLFIEMTDDPYDPATWLIDKISAESGSFENLIEATRPVLDGLVFDLMMDYAPDYLNKVLDLGEHFGEVARRFGIESTIDVKDTGNNNMTATHVVSGFFFTIDGADYAYDAEEAGSNPIQVDGVGVAYENNDIILSNHSVPLPYGGLLAAVLNDVIVPMADPYAADLGDMLLNMVDCYSVGARISAQVGYGSTEFYEGLCEIGLEAGANYALDQLVSIDESYKVTLKIDGKARASDKDGDRRIDTLTGGDWNGIVDYAGDTGNLTKDANPFIGERM